MENLITLSCSRLEDIQLSIYDSEIVYYGGSQYWFPKKINRLSGCGPVAAANITAYLAQAFPDKFSKLYPYDGILKKKDFVDHMVEIRKYVKPGFFGLTSVHQFSDNVLSFSKKRDVTLKPHILDDNSSTMEDAVSFISKALLQRLPVAILVLTHPLKGLEEYTWHWMTITSLKLDSDGKIYYISVSTYGQCREINLDMLWNHRRPKDIIRLAYFD